MEKFEAPDGGYGWVIVMAFAVNNIIIIPIAQGFGLLFRYVFTDLQMPATDISTIINVNSAFGLLMGLFNGPLLKKFGYRKMALTGTCFLFVGFALTSLASSFAEFIIYYGIINSLGFCFSLASYSLALNTYFNKRRNLASGFCSAVTGLGPVLMPITMSFLIEIYGVRGTALILAGLTLNSIACGLLLHPVKWHYRKTSGEQIIEKELELLNPPPATIKASDSEPEITKENEDNDDDDESNEECDIQCVLGIEKAMIPSKPMENGGGLLGSKLSLYEKTPDSTWWRKSSNAGIPPYTPQHSVKLDKKEKKKSKSKKWFTKIVKLFDLDLLQDPGYRMIWLGMSLAFTGEINFSLMTPMILGDKGWSVMETANLMSSLAFSDIIFRFISPFIGDLVKLPAKQMYMTSLVLLIITRSSLTLVSSWKETLISCIFIGMAKGFRTVYMGLVIPSYVPLEKLPSASGLQTVLNGLFLMVVGPVLGYIRDKSGNYNLCIHVINVMSLITVFLWTVELIFAKLELKKATKQRNQIRKPIET